MPGPTVGAGPHAFPLQFRVHSAAGAAGPAAGEPYGASHLGVPPLSSSRAGSPYPRHLARALDFPGSAHPRQERGGATLTQHGVTAPGDDAGHVDLESNHQVGDQDSFPPKAGCRGGFTIPVWEWPEPARHGASAPAWGQQVLQGDYWVQILGTVHRQTSIQIRYRSNFAVPVSQMSSVMQQENRAGTTMTPALNQRPWSTSRRFTPIRRWNGGCISMIPALGLRSSVVPESPARPFTGQWPGPGPAAAADPATEERYPRRDDHGVKPDPLANQLPRALRHSGHGLRT